jgi:hypothetical protein
MWGLTIFLYNFCDFILFYLLLDVEAWNWSCLLLSQHCHAISCPPHTASCWIKDLHHLRTPDHQFHGIHMDTQCVQITSEVTLAQYFNSIESCHACVDLDQCFSSATWASTTSGIYLESHCCWGCSNLALFDSSSAPLAWFHLKTFLFSLYIN